MKPMAITYLDIIRMTRDPSATASTQTGTALIDAILLERRKELYGEGVADFPDNRRLGRDWQRSEYHARITTRKYAILLQRL